MERLNKYLASCGVGSRRECDKLIQNGEVKVNGKIATLGTTVAETDRVTVRGKRVAQKPKNFYVMLHKPKGYVTTVKDELGRKTVMDLVADVPARLFPVGRLDYDTEGLLLLTNDGDVANKLTHPKNKVEKTYVARLSGSLTQAERLQLQTGVTVDGLLTAPAKVAVLERDEHHTRVEISVTEGRNHQIKKMFEYVGKEVEFLKRVSVGELHLGGLRRGSYRFLNDKELAYINSLK